ncbi:hypothetical protein G7Z17_g6486 [Cylindrodendrum hubeiense]|uniref:Amine oxidase n=1 Tax=Cylindrodendrum hubeiense TaxID=595255 RepID=A0A9P5LAS3_9HYPO|nr:hypothetical protein G7Z17_g6486 [Cylindrodendrum hubeiense]
MLKDTTSLPGFTVLREESGDVAPDLSKEAFIHPLDPLSVDEIRVARKLVLDHASPKQLKFNCLTLREPKKLEYAAFRAGTGPRPDRRAFAVIIERPGSQVAEVLISLTHRKVEDWKPVYDVGPTLTFEDQDICERIARDDPRVIEACREVGITDMSKVFVDPWAIGVDNRWGFERRLQQGLVYYRNSENDNQYAHPLDFTIVFDTELEEVIAVDIRYVNGERTLPPLTEHNYMPEFVGDDYVDGVFKPINITQPEGVSFRMRGNEISWAGYKMHIGFNFREGIVLSDIRIKDQHEQRERTLFNRLSVVEMVVPYGNPDTPHHRKHAFDVGEYGTGLISNPLQLGCDCKGAIHYLDATMTTQTGEPAILKNAICIHEEDNGLLYKHTDYRNGRVISARDRKLIISQIITAANYDYAFYHTFTLDGTYKLEMKLTGMLNTYCMHPTEEAAPFGNEIAPRINAHNHQHIFSLRVDPEIDGPNNSIIQNDATTYEEPLGSEKNPYGNGFYCKKSLLRTAKEAAVNINAETSRSWDIINPNSINPACKKPVAYKILNGSSPGLMAQPGSVVWDRAAFARKSLWVVPYKDYELYPAGDYVCQSTGEPDHPYNKGVADWTNRDEPIENTDIVCYVQFGITHFPRTEDFPVMPAEPVSVMLRASNFFQKNPGLWVPPSALCVDAVSKNAFPKKEELAPASSCCASRPAPPKL